MRPDPNCTDPNISCGVYPECVDGKFTFIQNSYAWLCLHELYRCVLGMLCPCLFQARLIQEGQLLLHPSLHCVLRANHVLLVRHWTRMDWTRMDARLATVGCSTFLERYVLMLGVILVHLLGTEIQMREESMDARCVDHVYLVLLNTWSRSVSKADISCRRML